jgi:hypothetical protein
MTSYGLDGRGFIPGRDNYLSLLHSVQTDSGAHSASYPLGTGGSFPGDKAVGNMRLSTHVHLLPR